MAVLRVAAVLVAAAGVLVIAAGAGTQVSKPILSTRFSEERPVSGSGYLAWAQNGRKHPKLYKVYARYRSGRPFLVSRRYQGYPGGISGTTLVYQEGSPTRWVSDIRFYDLQRKRHMSAPRGVNTDLWEWRPSLSGDWLLFSRNDGRTEAVVLRNLRTRAQIELDRGRMPDDANYGLAGQVNGDFAVWHRCPRGVDSPCVVFRYQISTRTKTPLRAPAGYIHYAPSVAADGTTYLIRSEFGCGSRVRLWRYPVSGEPTALFEELVIGRTVWNTYLETRTTPDGSVNDIYHDRGDCDWGMGDGWRHSDG